MRLPVTDTGVVVVAARQWRPHSRGRVRGHVSAFLLGRLSQKPVPPSSLVGDGNGRIALPGAISGRKAPTPLSSRRIQCPKQTGSSGVRQAWGMGRPHRSRFRLRRLLRERRAALLCATLPHADHAPLLIPRRWQPEQLPQRQPFRLLPHQDRLNNVGSEQGQVQVAADVGAVHSHPCR